MRTYASGAPADAPEPENPLEGVAFELDGVRFECAGRLSVLDTSEMAAAAVAAVDSEAPEGAAVISEFLRAAFGPEVYRMFRAHVRKHRTSDETLLDIIAGLNEEVEGNVAVMAGRPTGSPSPSSPGQTGRGGRSAQLRSLATGDVSVVPDGPQAPALAAERKEQAAARRAARGGKPKRPAARQEMPHRIVKLG